MFKELNEQLKKIEDLKKKQNLIGNLSTRVCFDRKHPMIFLSDGVSEISLTEEQMNSLFKHYMYSFDQDDTPHILY